MSRPATRAAVAAPFMVVGLLFIGRAWVDGAVATVAPVVEPRTLSLFDTTPVAITTTAFWHKIPRTVTVHELLRDHTVWGQMQFGDWDAVPRSLRERALQRMLRRYGRVLDGPASWSTLSVFDWDGGPQPLRA